MKSIKFFFACVLALTFVACSNAESDSFEDNSSNFESMISLYGIQSATVISITVLCLKTAQTKSYNSYH